MTKIIVVIPAFNEETTIRDIVSRALNHCSQVIVVNDGSSDNTAERVGDLPITIVNHTTNCGKAASIWHGMSTAIQSGADWVITMDADGQHLPEDIPRFISLAQQYPGHIITGSRLAEKEAFPLYRYCGNKFANFWISWAAGYGIEDSQCGFRLYPVLALDAVLQRCDVANSFVFESEILIEAARQSVYSLPLPIPAIYVKNSRPSYYRPLADTWRITCMVATKLISRGMYLQGLARSLGLSRHPATNDCRVMNKP